MEIWHRRPLVGSTVDGMSAATDEVEVWFYELPSALQTRWLNAWHEYGRGDPQVPEWRELAKTLPAGHRNTPGNPDWWMNDPLADGPLFKPEFEEFLATQRHDRIP
jgi:hypothetical protein